MPKSKAEIAKYARGWRKENYLEKRFNKPLREFLEIKYRDTYNEYCWFFRSLNEKHPDSKDLTKTFKEWKSRQLNCQSSDDEIEQSEAETGPDETEQSEVETEQSEVETGPNETEQGEVETGPNETEQSEAESDHPVSDILSVTINETLPPDNIDNIDNIIQQVINELEQDEAIRHMLNDEEFVHPHYQDEDEGIDLDVETELEAIIEPFDYQLEVEGVDY